MTLLSKYALDLFVLGLFMIFLVLSQGCAHVCAKTWETGAEVSHSVLFGPGYGTHLTLGGELGESQCKAKAE